MDESSFNPECGTARFRKWRIAWSEWWGVVCLLLIVLWVRSKDGKSIEFSTGKTDVYLLPRYNSVILALVPSGTDVNELWGLKTIHPFEVVRFRSWKLYQLPHWFLIAISATLATAPWFPWRFSLRTLLIVMTIVAALLGWAVWATK
jgi:hypothetical protein